MTITKAETARRLMANTDESIKQISAKVRISNCQHFNNHIRCNTGMSPTDCGTHARKVQ